MVRIYLTGRLVVDAPGGLLEPTDFPGQQGRNLFAFLATERNRPFSRGELVEALWPAVAPASRDSALSAIVSKLRSALDRVGFDGSSTLTSVAGCYQLRLPHGSWIDMEAAADSIHEAETALRAGDPARAYGPSAVAHHIARRPFLPGEEAAWIERRREKLRSILVRALECRAEVYLWNHEFPLAIELARDAIELEPFRESGYRLLMRAHVAAGNAAEALRTYERCRALISEELGVQPSPETRAVHLEVLGAL